MDTFAEEARGRIKEFSVQNLVGAPAICADVAMFFECTHEVSHSLACFIMELFQHDTHAQQ